MIRSRQFPDGRFGPQNKPLKICKYYMVGKCKYASCGLNGCGNLHLCRHFVNGECTFNAARCKFSHNVNYSGVVEILLQHGIYIKQDISFVLQDIRNVIARHEKMATVQPSPVFSKIGTMRSLPSRPCTGPGTSQYGHQFPMTEPTMQRQQEPRICSSPQICTFYNVEAGCRNEKEGRSCPYLHLCRHYVMGSCKFGRGCKRSHTLDQMVKQILVQNGVSVDRRPAEILAEVRDLLSGEQEEQVLQPTARMNTVPGPILQPALDPKAPTFDVKSMRHALQRDISVDDELREICLHYLKRSCAFGKSCRKIHKDMPYQWQHQTFSDIWADFDAEQNTHLELKFSDPKTDICCVDLGNSTSWNVDFDSFTAKHPDGQTISVRRLSTVSHVDAECQPLATHWNWCWLEQTNKWVPYGEVSVEGSKCELSSDNIEQKYLVNPETTLQFSTECHEYASKGHQYILDFRKMLQKNIDYKTERKVKRRPTFLSRDEVDKKRKEKIVSGPRNVVGGVLLPEGLASLAPSTWALKKSEDIVDHYEIIEVSKHELSTRNEFSEIESLFMKTMPSTTTVVEIQRIENGELWIDYVGKREKMKRKLSNKVDERRLFHATEEQYKDAICKQGFDFRLSGQRIGKAYGRGSYFGTTSAVSDKYAGYDRKTFMFVVKVLVGDFTTGSPSYVRPPSKNKSDLCSDLYDSCVDNTTNPKMFIIFDITQVYPEYMIKYQRG